MIPVSIAQIANNVINYTHSLGSSTSNPNHVHNSNGCVSILLHKLYKYDVSCSLEDMQNITDLIVADLQVLGYKVLYQPLSNIEETSSSNCSLMNPVNRSLSPLFDRITTGSTTGAEASPKPEVSLEVYNFGHMGDNNLHFNVLLRPQYVNVSSPSIDGSCTDVDIKDLKHDLLALIYADIDWSVYRHIIAKRGVYFTVVVLYLLSCCFL